MREHTVTKIRDLLSSDDRDAVAGLKEKQAHRFRNLSERALTKSQAMAYITRGGDPKRVLNKTFWKDVAQLIVHGEIDPTDMKPLFAPKSASSLEKLGVLAPGASRAVIGGLRGLKKIKSALGDASKKRPSAVFDTDDSSYDECSKRHPVGSPAYYRCMDRTSHRGYGGYSRSSHRDDSIEIPMTGIRDKRGTSDLTQEIQSKLLQFGSARALAKALSKLKK